MKNEFEGTKNNLTEMFGTNVFNDAVMKERLPKDVYEALRKAIDEGIPLDRKSAGTVANAMKNWAIENGATHFTHWFQPMTGVTAEKHEAFLQPTSDGMAITEFSAKELIKGESDASSFPSGGLRATFEARGYTVWDCTSPAFLREDEGGVTLYIPTAFCSYTGEALDKKTPLLRSMQILSKQAVRILRLFGDTETKEVIPTVGPEQEYFLVDLNLYKKRKDLLYTGHTLFGINPPKGQELEDHYYGSLKEKIAGFMKEIDVELWKLGVYAKTKHNEVAPAQHELATIFTNANIATDHNQLVMDTLKKVAVRHGLACLLHEKPFAGLNGSGKHNNWSLSTVDGKNLLNPGKNPAENTQFLVFLCSVIKAVDEYPELLRLSAANTGNDYRLGANEAPPAIVSMFLGDALYNILENLGDDDARSSTQREELNMGLSNAPVLHKDNTDRNRTSPFAFTGNKFEFRMVPSSASISDANVVLNTIVADSLSKIADRLEKAADLKAETQKLLKEIFKKHKKIIFNGDGYSEDWVKEAEKRGLPNIKTTVEAIPYMIDKKSIELFEKHGVFSGAELNSRYEIMLESYIKKINIEALTMLDMARHEILPASIKYLKKVADCINSVKATGIYAETDAEEQILVEISSAVNSFRKNMLELEKIAEEGKSITSDNYSKAKFYRKKVFSAMGKLRKDGDRLETLVDGSAWPMPTYGDLLFSL